MEQHSTVEMKNSKPDKLKAQRPKLKAFEVFQKHFATLGITPSFTAQSYPFNGAILFQFLVFGSAIYFTSVFIAYDAKTFSGYTQSVYTGSVIAFVTLAILILIFKAEEIFKIIDGSDTLVNTGELSKIYQTCCQVGIERPLNRILSNFTSPI